jgi:aldehyde:ferredoxin oxidoreductase
MNITMPDYRETVEKFVIDGGYGSFCPCILGSYFMCNMVAEINEGNYKGTRVSMGLSQGAFMARNLGISLPAAFRLRELCHRYGLDYWEEPLLFFLELYQKGIITKSDTDGLEIVKGNEPVMIELLGKIAYRNGFGDIIAEGVERASKIIGRGSENYVISMKGLELVGDPRTFSPDKRLSIQVNPRGGDDLKGTHGAMPFWGEPIWARRLNWNEEEYLDWVLKRHDMFDDVKKIVYGSPPNLHNLDSAMLVKWYNDLSCVFNSLGFCMFSDSFEAMGPTLYAELYSDVTGHLISPVELMVVGERVFNVMRSFNVREGMRREQDDYPQRFYEQSLRRGDETYTLSKEAVDRSLQTYYEYRGWDTKTGVPTQEKLRELQLHDVADDMKKLSY